MSDDYLQRIEKQAKEDARDADETYSVLLDGQPGQTLSERAALGARAGIWRWCVFCRVLSLLVEKDHCEKTLDPDAVSPPSVYWRAGVCFVLATAAVIGGMLWLVSRCF